MLEYQFEDVPAPGEVREVAPGVLWLRMPLPMALDHINLYLLEDADGWWVVDTGIAIGSTEELWEQVFEQHLLGKPVKAVISTHYHPDHTGMAGWLCEKWRVPFYMTQGEYLSGLSFSRMMPEHFSWTSEQHFHRAILVASGPISSPCPRPTGAWKTAMRSPSTTAAGASW
jgi:hypothetical protein